MATYVGEANDEVASQVELLAQAVAALEGKAVGGESGAEWLSLAQLPTAFAASPDGEDIIMYMEISMQNCMVIIAHVNPSTKKVDLSCTCINADGISQYASISSTAYPGENQRIVMDGNTRYYEIKVSPMITLSDYYYVIFPVPQYNA